MRCSVVIPCHNGADLTRACIDSLLHQAGSPELEILLVDNASSDHTAQLAAVDPAVRVLGQDHNRGFAGGVNAGIRAARHPFVLVLNNDTQAAPNLLQELHRTLEADPRIGAVAPTSNHVKGAARLAIGDQGRTAAGRQAIAEQLAALPPIEDVDTLAGLCLLMRRQTFAAVGLFDERFGHGNFEDDDLCLRLRLAGHRLVIARRAFLHHEGHATFRAMGLALADEIHKRRAQFVAKWQHDPAGRAAIAALAGDVERAAAAAAEARTTWPLWPDAEWHLARACEARGDHTLAAVHYRALLRACPHHAEAAVALAGQLLSAGATAAAHLHLTWTVANCHLTPEREVRMLRSLGLLAHTEGRHADAAADFRAALATAPEDGGLHNWLGVSLLAAGDLHSARDAFAAAVDCGLALAHTNLGICEHRLGEPVRALECFAKAAALLPHDRVVQANYAALRQQPAPV